MSRNELALESAEDEVEEALDPEFDLGELDLLPKPLVGAYLIG